jgi:hypothetical protein
MGSDSPRNLALVLVDLGLDLFAFLGVLESFLGQSQVLLEGFDV